MKNLRNKYVVLLLAFGIIIASIVMAPANAESQAVCSFYDSVNNVTLFSSCIQNVNNNIQNTNTDTQDFAYSEGELAKDPC